MSEAMAAEFDTVAAWTSEVALDLGPEYLLPAACRGSASPGALRWLLEHLDPTAETRMLDCGAGADKESGTDHAGDGDHGEVARFKGFRELLVSLH